MALSTGVRLGPYEIVGPLGAGGMGEVYRARDTRLHRDVAIKILPATYSSDPERLRRFEQEARAAAALNNPNICAVYDIGADNDAPYIVSELLEGESLRESLLTGALSVRKAIDYAIQIAHGLSAAHDKGIIHRDLKPENIFITHEGRAKLLDFGLAKLVQREIPNDGRTQTGVIESNAGTVLGTVGYMSPEQVRAKQVDARSDLFSFGAILYEMLSGKRAFHGESAAETMSAIVKEDSPDLTETNRNISPALERIVRHCLEKNPAQRFQSAHDLAFDLESVSGSSKTSSIKVAAPPKRRWLLPTAIAVFLIAALGGAYWWGHANHPTKTPEFHQLTFRRGTIYRARFAPDGTSILYSASWEGKPIEMFTTRYDSVESRPFASGALVAAVSSKNQVAVILEPKIISAGTVCLPVGTLALIPLDGGAPRPLVQNAQWADWSLDGNDLAVIRSGADGAIPNELQFPLDKTIYRPAHGWLSDVRFSPDGQHLAVAEHIPGGDDGEVVILDRNGKLQQRSPHFPSLNSVAWGNKDEVWFTASAGSNNESLYGLDLRGRSRRIYQAPNSISIHDVSSAGRVLLTSNNERIVLMGGKNGEQDKDLSWFDWSLAADISADGSTVLFGESSPAVNGNAEAFLRKLDGSPAVMLGEGRSAAISPDGNWVTVVPPLLDRIDLLPTGVGRPRTLASHSGWEYRYRMNWSSDSKSLYVDAREPNHGWRVCRVDVESGQITPLLPEGIRGAIPSPDGALLVAYDKDTPRIYTMAGKEVRALPELDPRDAMDKWTTDGKGILVWNIAGGTARLDRMDAITGKRTEVYEIRPPDPSGIVNIAFCRTTPDARFHVYSEHRLLTDLQVASGLQ